VITRTTFDVGAITLVAGVDISVRGGKARAAACRRPPARPTGQPA